MAAQFEVEFLADGQIKVKTGNLQGEHHASADEFVKLVVQLVFKRS